MRPPTANALIARWGDEHAPEEPEVGFLSASSLTLDDVGGLEEVKRRLELSFLSPLRNPELREAFGKRVGGGLLLLGPPGCGKTFIDTARRSAPCVLFFDEIDALGIKRSQLRGGGSAMRGVVNQLLAELDGASSDNEGVFVLAATNHPWDVDSALVRPGRFDRSILVLPPDRDARLAILQHHLKDRPVADLDLNRVADKTDGLTGADLALVCEQAVETALESSLKSGRVDPVTTKALLRSAKGVRPSTGQRFQTAKNHAMFNNEDGAFDDLLAYMKRRR